MEWSPLSFFRSLTHPLCTFRASSGPKKLGRYHTRAASSEYGAWRGTDTGTDTTVAEEGEEPDDGGGDGGGDAAVVAASSALSPTQHRFVILMPHGRAAAARATRLLPCPHVCPAVGAPRQPALMSSRLNFLRCASGSARAHKLMWMMERCQGGLHHLM